MIKAKPYQQQPPKPSTCKFCDERFNNVKRMTHHIDMKRNRGDSTHGVKL